MFPIKMDWPLFIVSAEWRPKYIWLHYNDAGKNQPGLQGLLTL